MVVYKYKLICRGEYHNKESKTWTAKRAEQYFFNDFSEVIGLRLKESLPLDNDTVLELRTRGRSYKYIGTPGGEKNIRFFFKIEETSEKFRAHYSRLKT